MTTNASAASNLEAEVRQLQDLGLQGRVKFHRRMPPKKSATIAKAWPGALLLDETPSGDEPWTRFSPFVLLDDETNGDVEDLSRPLSHAALIKSYLEENWPSCPGSIAEENQTP